MFYVTNKHKQYANHILVEFQRRNGDGFVFGQFLNSIFNELSKTQIIQVSKFKEPITIYPKPLIAPQTARKRAELKEEKEQKAQEKEKEGKQIDYDTLKVVISALFDGDCTMCRSSASYLANNIANNIVLVHNIIKLEPHIIHKFSELLLKCVDPQIVRSIGSTLYYMLQQSDELKDEATQN
eukprot:TRINITY_DN343_c0_g1_i2.p1 TRINITY_DN343_c0_g1~~TRINITY_DN343_c0_g1_i2.p1  ORF type:complete len:182 (-),score=39.01 TRINITY_DN343_c0_g1_i2:235-780(-)